MNNLFKKIFTLAITIAITLAIAISGTPEIKAQDTVP